MKPTKLLRIMSLTLCAAIALGCQKQSKSGEAFVVLKSDAVIYMADMQVLGFKPEFKQHFTDWRKGWEAAYKYQVTDIEKTNPNLQAKLKQFDTRITDQWAETNNVRREALSFLIRSADTERARIAAELGKTTKAYEEYKQISAVFGPFGLLEKEINIRRQRRAIADQTITKLNQHIANAQLSTPKLETSLGENIFAGDWRESYRRTGLVVRFDQGEAVWFYQIPEKLQGSVVEGVIRTGYLEYKRLGDELEKAQRLINQGDIAAKQALTDWVQRHGLEAGRSNLEATLQRLNTQLSGLNEQLKRLNSGSAESSDEMRVEVGERLGKINKQVEEIKKQRRQAIVDAAEIARPKVKLEFRSKFNDLIKQCTASSVQTGSKGDFTIPGSIAFVYAERYRENEETLIWLLPVDPKATKVRLSNSNAAVASSNYDQFWMLDWKLD